MRCTACVFDDLVLYCTAFLLYRRSASIRVTSPSTLARGCPSRGTPSPVGGVVAVVVCMLLMLWHHGGRSRKRGDGAACRRSLGGLA